MIKKILKNFYLKYFYLRKFKNLSTEQIFSKIYESNLWGGREGEYSSGIGSTNKMYFKEYNKYVCKFIQQNKCQKILDIGCGDFMVGKNLIETCNEQGVNVDYTGIDIVKGLVEYNQTKFSQEKVKFKQANMISDNLPNADLAIIRQVFQHLSNTDIKKCLGNLKHIKYLIITEHQPNENFITKPNMDKLTGPNIRLDYNSGIYLDKPPFNLATHKIYEVPLNKNEGVISTFVVENRI